MPHTKERPSEDTPDEDNECRHQVFDFKRELSEVHMLLDSLSANPDQSLPLNPGKDTGLDKDWLEKICLISYPPDGSGRNRAKQASLLIRAKDYLNSQAKPASGMSIAFTLLVTQENQSRFNHFWRQPSSDQVKQSSRWSQAYNAYPGLSKKAKWFSLYLGIQTIGLLALLFATCVLSCYAAFGNATLAQRASAVATFAEAQKQVATDEENIDRKAAPAAAAEASSTASPNTPPVLHLCDQAATDSVKFHGNSIPLYPSVAAMHDCDASNAARRDVRSADETLKLWLAPVLAVFDSKHKGEDGVSRLAGTVVSLLASSVLPVFYGTIGAAAAVVRGLWRKIKTSQLTPRDRSISMQQLALGAVMGACIGLFVSQPSASSQNDPGLIGAVALSSSALSFVAGFGVENVFGALEAMIDRVFPRSPPPKPKP